MEIEVVEPKQLSFADYLDKPIEELESIIERGLHTFIEVGFSLRAIRYGRKYREEGYATFDEYLAARWGFTRINASYRIKGAVIANSLLTRVNSEPEHEAQVRPLSRLGWVEDGGGDRYEPREIPEPDEDMIAAWVEGWQEAGELAAQDYNERVGSEEKWVQPTRRQVNEAVTYILHGDPPPLPEGVYRVIYADPPWKYSDSLLDGYGPADAQTNNVGHYPTMSLKQLCELEIQDLAADDSVLFLWTTSPMLEDAFKVIKAWGFKYKASFIWDKVKHNYGHYNSVRHEFLLIATRGSCTPEAVELFDSVQSIERGEHSEKPAEFRTIIETLYPSGPRVELFARQVVDGWKGWGNEYRKY